MSGTTARHSPSGLPHLIIENTRAHSLVLHTPFALDRCEDAADWLRHEIENALADQRDIISRMLEGFDFGAPVIARQLTGGLEALNHYNALRITPDFFDEAMERLRTKFLNVPLAAGLHHGPSSAQRAAREQKAAADAAPPVQEELTAQRWFERGFAAADADEKLRC